MYILTVSLPWHLLRKTAGRAFSEDRQWIVIGRGPGSLASSPTLEKINGVNPVVLRTRVSSV
jgi:hypothetical protein